MKTIKIQNCTDNQDNLFKVFINGEKHIVRYQSKIQVVDDQPFEIKAKYIWGGSPKYTFEPKENMVLQIFVSQRLIDISLILIIVAGVLVTAAVGKGLFYYISEALWVILLILHFIIRRKKSFIIQEIKKEQDE